MRDANAMLMTETIQSLIRMISDNDVDLLYVAGVLSDPITRRILAKLEGPQSPITLDSIPCETLGATKPQIINRLVRLKNIGLVKSTKVKSSMGYSQRYEIEPSVGTKLVKQLIKSGSSGFS